MKKLALLVFLLMPAFVFAVSATDPYATERLVVLLNTSGQWRGIYADDQLACKLEFTGWPYPTELENDFPCGLYPGSAAEFHGLNNGVAYMRGGWFNVTMNARCMEAWFMTWGEWAKHRADGTLPPGEVVECD
jgi:hypothetical protein